jgi:transketolase
MHLTDSLLASAAVIARGLAIDAITGCKSGHLGLPLGAAELGAVLFGDTLRFDPTHHRWLNRDRFVLSAGHGSMFLYAWLHLAGYELELDDLRAFRRLGSRTPGHPEFGHTPGVECTSGPLGQGVGNAVGMAMAARMVAARCNTGAAPLLDYKIYCLLGDGCLQEGVCQEASALAGHHGLDNLVLLWDSNGVTLDAMLEDTQSEDTLARYRALGFEVRSVDGHDIPALRAVLAEARDTRGGRPWFIQCRTQIARGIPQVAGTPKGHGEGGTAFAAEARAALGLPAELFHVSPEVRRAFLERAGFQASRAAAWQKRWQAALDGGEAGPLAVQATFDPGLRHNLQDAVPPFAPGKALATRVSAGEALSALGQRLPLLVSGSADLHGSTRNVIAQGGDFTPASPAGRNIRFGIREHAMGAILNGMAYDGLVQPSGATFMVFADYLRPAIRLAALAGLPVVYFFTHDSVGVGEDGPTHQPVETVAALRLLPGLDVIRPADSEETAGAVCAAFERHDGPTVLSLSRQNLPDLGAIPAAIRRRGAHFGGYIARVEEHELALVILASGSELALALEAAERLGPSVRVVSMPCMERFAREPRSYRDLVLPPECRARLAIEAGVSASWHPWVGDGGRILGIDRFGLSAPGDTVMAELGITVEALAEAGRALMATGAPLGGGGRR